MLAPQTEADLATLIKDSTTPVRIQGGGSRDIGRPISGDVISTTGLTGITLYEPGALTMVVRAGTPLAEVEAALDEQAQQLPFEPLTLNGLLATQGNSTIGGVVATNASGPRRLVAGACRDSLIGVRFVDGTGQILKNGGRVMKNVTGYDLVKLLAGSYGTLGVMTEVAFKVLPKPETTATLTIHGQDIAGAVAAMSDGLGSPFEVTAAAFDPAKNTTMLRIEGFEASVAYRADQLRNRLSRFGEITIADAKASATLWADTRDVTAFHEATGDIWRISVKPSDAAAVANAIHAEAMLFDWGGGLIWARVPARTNLRKQLTGIAGHATLMRADSATRAAIAPFHPETPTVAALSNGLRAKFDPRGILNTGLMG